MTAKKKRVVKKRTVKKYVSWKYTGISGQDSWEEYMCSGCKNLLYSSELAGLPNMCPYCGGHADSDDWY